ncbi:hypothetical protein F0267_00490 [Vibrio coralliilyticus]|uniref:Lipoprotein n=1 Tax=Vibrio coralliilyticus TaxID=190893 RepID=A0AAN0SHV5_9VIBR|nr:hypothetical protein [Vibrio coralliilyticus]AIW22600.1 hypothetical protein IX92_26420 [Vibrio coralliilyticus]NOH36697.1 hypothetical protein [Vibrio coralliilyticus]
MKLRCNKQKRFAALTALGILLTGCGMDDLKNEMVTMVKELGPTTIYIASPVELLIDDNSTAMVYGYEKCPDNDSNWLWLVPPSNDVQDNNCIKLDESTSEVKVGLSTKDRTWNETWRVAHHGDAITLMRSNGFEIKRADQGI